MLVQPYIFIEYIYKNTDSTYEGTKMVSITRLLPPSEWVNKQVKGMQATGEANYKYGVSHPHKDPIAAGVAAEDKWQNQLRLAFERGTRAKHQA